MEARKRDAEAGRPASPRRGPLRPCSGRPGAHEVPVVPGVLVGGRFFSDTRPGGLPGVFSGMYGHGVPPPEDAEAIARRLARRERRRYAIARRVFRESDRPSPYCSACRAAREGGEGGEGDGRGGGGGRAGRGGAGGWGEDDGLQEALAVREAEAGARPARAPRDAVRGSSPARPSPPPRRPAFPARGESASPRASSRSPPRNPSRRTSPGGPPPAAEIHYLGGHRRPVAPAPQNSRATSASRSLARSAALSATRSGAHSAARSGVGASRGSELDDGVPPYAYVRPSQRSNLQQAFSRIRDEVFRESRAGGTGTGGDSCSDEYDEGYGDDPGGGPRDGPARRAGSADSAVSRRAPGRGCDRSCGRSRSVSRSPSRSQSAGRAASRSTSRSTSRSASNRSAGSLGERGSRDSGRPDGRPPSRSVLRPAPGLPIGGTLRTSTGREIGDVEVGVEGSDESGGDPGDQWGPRASRGPGRASSAGDAGSAPESVPDSTEDDPDPLPRPAPRSPVPRRRELIGSLRGSQSREQGPPGARRRRPVASLYDLARESSQEDTDAPSGRSRSARSSGSARDGRARSPPSAAEDDGYRLPAIGEALVARYADIRKELRETTRYKAEELLADMYDDKILLEKELRRAVSQQEIYSLMRKLKANEDLSMELQRLLEVSVAAEEGGRRAGAGDAPEGAPGAAVATYPFQHPGPAGGGAGAQGPGGSASSGPPGPVTPQGFLRTHALIFSPNAAKAFNANKGVIKTACPQSLYAQDSPYRYIGPVVEPLLIVGTTLLDLEMLPALRTGLSKALFVRETGNLLSPFERNLLWAILTFVVFRHPEVLFRQFPQSVLQDVTFLLPCEPAMRPVYSLVEATLYLPGVALRAYGVATVAVPYYDDRPALPRASRVEKVAAFQKRMHFNHSGLKECLDRCVRCLRRHVQDGCGYVGGAE